MRAKPLWGTVLHVRNFGDAHRIFEVLTAEEGRLSAVARHARQSRRRFGGALDLFATAELTLTPSSSLWRLEQASRVRPRIDLRSDLARIARASIFCGAVRLLVAEHQAAPEVFGALGRALDQLEAGRVAPAAGFYVELLRATGLLPDVSSCSRCGRQGVAIAAVDRRMGGVLCESCAEGSRPLPRETMAALAGGPCADEQTAAALESFAVAWIESQAGRPLLSAATLPV